MGPPEPTPELLVRQSALRRRLSERSLATFCRVYLADHFPLPNSSMHDEVMDQMSWAIPARGARIAAAVPQGFGKTTMASIALPLWALAFGHTKHCVLMSDARSRAGEALAAIGRELCQNWRIANDFPHLRKPTSTALTARELLVGDARVSAVSRSVGLGSRRFGPRRPDLVIVDDAEGSWAQFKPLSLEWLRNSVVSPSAANASIVVMGTVWDGDSMLEQLLSPSVAGSGWWTRRYKAVLSYPSRTDLWVMWELVFHEIADFKGQTGPAAATRLVTEHRPRMAAGGRLLWPERDDLTEVLQRKVRDGWWRFETAMLNQPPSSVVTLDIYERRDAPPSNRWTDDAGMVRDSYNNDPSTARVLLTRDAADPNEEWAMLSLDTRKPCRPRKDPAGSPRLQVESLIDADAQRL